MSRPAADSVMARGYPTGIVRMPPLLTGAAFLLLYILLEWASHIFPYGPFGITPWKPGTGLAWAFILLCGPRYLPLLFCAPFIAETLLPGPTPWWLKLTGSVVIGAGYAAALSILLRPRTRFDVTLGNMRDILLLVGTAIVSTGLVALAYVTLMVASLSLPVSDYQWAILRFWIGDLIGIVVVTPFLLVHTAAGRLPRPTLETLLQATTILLALFMVFGPIGGEYLRLFYLLFVPIIWMGLRDGLEGVTTGLVLAQIGVVVGLLLTAENVASVKSLQALLLVLALTGLAIGVVVSERRRAERQLWLNQEAFSRISRLRSMGEFATVIAHEVNQPLTAISNYTRLIKRYLETDSGSKASAIEAATKAIVQVDRAAAIIKSLRDLIRLGRSEFAPQSVARIVRESVDLLEPNLQRASVDLKIRIPKDLPLVHADLMQVEQVLLNIVRNAIEAIEGTGAGQGSITISAAPEGPDFVEISVRDTGPGFPPDFRNAQVGPALSTKPDGLGLGLALSRSIVEHHGGRFTIGGGKDGAIVRFTLRTAGETT